MRIGIDIDGVLVDIEKFQLEQGSKYFFEKYHKKIYNPKGYETYQMFNVDLKKDQEFWKKVIFDYIKEPARNFAAEVIQKLKKEGNEIYIITARSSDVSYIDMTVEEMREAVKKWLKDYKIVYDYLIFSPEDKLSICLENKIDVMIEDSPKNIVQISEKIPVICYHAIYNDHCKAKNITRCYTWYDIYQTIKEEFFAK